MQGITQSKKVTNTFISTITHISVSLQSYTREKRFPSDMKGKGRKQTSVGWRWKRKKRSLLLVFILVPPSSSLPLPPSGSQHFTPPFQDGSTWLGEWFSFLQSHSTENEIFPAWVRLPCFVSSKQTAVLAPELVVTLTAFALTGALWIWVILDE